MMKDAFSKKFEMIMTLQLSRLGRSTKNLLNIVEKSKEKDINLFIANQQIDTSTSSGSMFFTIASECKVGVVTVRTVLREVA